MDLVQLLQPDKAIPFVFNKYCSDNKKKKACNANTKLPSLTIKQISRRGSLLWDPILPTVDNTIIDAA